MELEQMRFAHKFEFTFNIDPEINTKQVKIPSMLFQPYLENSIWHGILPMDKKGQLDVKITKEEGNSIKISIFDNGIGIETSLKMKDDTPRDHISVGMEITKNRLALYQQSNNSHASVVGPYEIKEDGITIGTQVELFLPMLDPE
jgi:LytS/YehU family sensor histidine kinase